MGIDSLYAPGSLKSCMCVMFWSYLSVASSLPLCSFPSPWQLQIVCGSNIYIVETNTTKQGLFFFSRALVVEHRLDQQPGSSQWQGIRLHCSSPVTRCRMIQTLSTDRKPMKMQQENGSKPQEEPHPMREVVLFPQWLNNVPQNACPPGAYVV